MIRVFLSYQFRERATADLLATRLALSNGDLDSYDQRMRVQESASEAAALKAEIAPRIATAGALVCIIGPTTATSSWVRWEVDEALHAGTPILVLQPNAADALPSPLFSSDPIWRAAQVEALIEMCPEDARL